MTVEQKLIQSITGELPQIDFVVDQVGAALALAADTLTERQFHRALRIAVNVTKFAKETSEPQYFKYNLIITALLKDVQNLSSHAGFKTFDTTSNIVGKNIEALKTTEDEKARGYYKGGVLKLARLFNLNQELFLIEVLSLTDDLEALDLVADVHPFLLGCAFMNANFRMCNFELLSSVQIYYNKFMSILENTKF